MSRFLTFLARATHRHPWAILLGCLALTALCAVAVVRKLTLQTDVRDLLPRDSEVARVTRSALDDFGAFDFMLAVVEDRAESPGADSGEWLTQAAPQIADALNDQRFFSQVQYKLESTASSLIEAGNNGSDSLIVNLLTDADWDAFEQRLSPDTIRESLVALREKLKRPLSLADRRDLLEDPLDMRRIIRARLTYSSGPAKLNVRRGFFLSEDGRMLLMILRPVRPSTDVLFSQELDQFLTETRDGLFRRNPGWKDKIRIDFQGAHVETARNASAVRSDLSATLFASFLGVIALFWLTFRRFEALYFIGLPLACGILWTLGFAAGTLLRISILSAAMGGVLIGLGVDYGILLYNRFIEEVQRGSDPAEAIETILRRTGRGIVTGGFTTAVGFLAMTLTSFEGFRELGLVTGMGILCCMASALLMIPAMMTLLMGRRTASIRRRPLLTLGLPQLAGMVLSRPRTTLAAGILLTVYFGYRAQGVGFIDSLREFQPESRHYANLQKRIDRHFETPSNQIVIIVEGKTLQDALECNDLLYRNIQSWQQVAEEKILALDSLRTYLPSARTQRASQKRFLSLLGAQWPGTKKQILEIGTQLGMAPETFDAFFDRIERLRAAAERGEVIEFGQGPLPSPYLTTIVQRYVTKREGRYRVLTQVYPPKGRWELEIPEAFLKNLKAGDTAWGKPSIPVDVTGVVVLSSRLKKIIIRDLAWTCLCVLAILMGILLIHFRRMGDTLLALIPVVLSLIWTLGLWSLFGFHMNFINIIVLPMILGIGVHAGLHLLERYREMGHRRLNLVMETTGRGLLLTALTTIVGFGSLAMAQFRGLQEIGLLVIIGVGTNLLATLIFLPVTIRFIERGLSFDDWNPQELD